MTKAQKAEREQAIEQLRSWIKPGDTVYTILDHVSASGMSRAIRVLIPTITGNGVEAVPPGGKPTDYVRKDAIGVDFLHPNWAVGKALGLRHWKRHGREQDALVVGGCGMDMGFHLVYELSYLLYDSGYTCLGKGKCPSNYHVNYRARVRCEGADRRFCWKPDRYNARFPAPEDWPEGSPVDIGEGQTLRGPLLACLTGSGEDGKPYEVCPTCQGVGDLPNPEGPERFDLLHTDGYALQHRWL